MIVGTFCLVTLGDPSTLLRSGLFARDRDRDGGEEQGRAVSALDRLSHLADLGQFREGLEAAVAVDVGALDRFDRLDWAFLKNYCAVQLAAIGETEELRARWSFSTRPSATSRLCSNRPRTAARRSTCWPWRTPCSASAGRGSTASSTAGPLLAAQAAGLPFDHNESVCLLGLAEERLGQGDAEEAGRLFDQVTQRGVLVDQIPTSLVKVRHVDVPRNEDARKLPKTGNVLPAIRVGGTQSASVRRRGGRAHRP